MEYFPAALEKLVEQFARLPGIGGKSAQRLAFHVLSLTDAEAQEFADAIVEAKKKVTCCPICRNLTDGGLCPICASPKRDERVICVVADARDVAALERSREYSGRYHVLHGVISPMNHVGPDDLEIKSLVERVAAGGIDEVIMAILLGIAAVGAALGFQAMLQQGTSIVGWAAIPVIVIPAFTIVAAKVRRAK